MERRTIFEGWFLPVVLVLPQLILGMVSTGFAPVDQFPDWIRGFARNQPISAFVNVLRALSGDTGPVTWALLEPGLLWLLGGLVLLGAVSAVATDPPADASSSDICLARSVTPDGVPSRSTPTRSARCGPPGQSSSTAEGTSADPAADATAVQAPAQADGPNSPVTQATAAGCGCNRKVASVISPSVPCEPEKSFPMS